MNNIVPETMPTIMAPSSRFQIVRLPPTIEGCAHVELLTLFFSCLFSYRIGGVCEPDKHDRNMGAFEGVTVSPLSVES